MGAVSVIGLGTLAGIERDDGSRYVRAETGGLVVLAFENKPTPTLEERTVLALSSLYIRRPSPKIYDKALIEARKKIKPG